MNVNTPRGLLRCVSPACLSECHEAQVVFRCVCPVCPVALCASCSRPGVVRRELVGDKRLIINDSGHRTRGNFTDKVTTSTGISLTRLITSASTVITAGGNRVYMTLTVKHFKKIAIFDSTSVIAEELLSLDLLKLAKKVTEWGKIATNNGADSCYVRLYDANKETVDIILENLSYKELSIILPFSLNYKSSLVSAFHFRENDKIKTHHQKDRNVLFGKSCHSLKSIKEAEQCGIDYVFFSPIFETQTHPEAKGIGLSMLRSACESTQMRVFALGGINENNYRQCLDVGASGIAAISMFTKSYVTRPKSCQCN